MTVKIMCDKCFKEISDPVYQPNKPRIKFLENTQCDLCKKCHTELVTKITEIDADAELQRDNVKKEYKIID